MEIPEESSSFERFSTARSTVARRCREYYHRRLERTEMLQRRWSVYKDESDQTISTQDVPDDKRSELCSDSSDSPLFRKCLENSYKSSELSSLPSGNDSGHASDSSESPPTDFRKGSTPADTTPSITRTCRSSLDIAMDNLRKEISSLIAQDNDLFRQLLSLNDSIAELRLQQEKNLSLWDVDYDSEHGSLESISDEETTSTVSPASTLSSCCSSHHLDSSKTTPLDWHCPVLTTEIGRQRSKSSVCRTVVPSDVCTSRQRTRSVLCLRCHGKGATPLYRRRAVSTVNLLWRPVGGGYEMDSFDSGIHIHSDSDHEIFV